MKNGAGQDMNGKQKKSTDERVLFGIFYHPSGVMSVRLGSATNHCKVKTRKNISCQALSAHDSKGSLPSAVAHMLLSSFG
mmetsp:Transcript_150426/g.262843  ORF Transcript_150426/g.262843 Transcript_150426/m.262843 type:complete len:80 (+) Transcript_150426:43-282(+)